MQYGRTIRFRLRYRLRYRYALPVSLEYSSRIKSSRFDFHTFSSFRLSKISKFGNVLVQIVLYFVLLVFSGARILSASGVHKACIGQKKDAGSSRTRRPCLCPHYRIRRMRVSRKSRTRSFHLSDIFLWRRETPFPARIFLLHSPAVYDMIAPTGMKFSRGFCLNCRYELMTSVMNLHRGSIGSFCFRGKE